MSELNRLPLIRKRLQPYLRVIDEYIAAEDQQVYYDVFKRPKRRGGHRFIYSCKDPNIRSAHKVLYEILRSYQGQVHDSAHGFIKKRSPLSNAQNHVQKKYILHLDIVDFFDSIGIKQVKTTLCRLGASEDVADFLSRLVTINGSLRQGLHTSPDLSNHCLAELDEALGEYADKNEITYTRYGDDMTFSSGSEPDTTAIRSIVESAGYIINDAKVKLQKRGSSQYVTGLTVFDAKPRIPKAFKKRLRLQMYYIKKYGFRDHVERTRSIGREAFGSEEDYQHYLEGKMHGSANYVLGHIGYLNSVEPSRALPFREDANDQNIRDYQ